MKTKHIYVIIILGLLIGGWVLFKPTPTTDKSDYKLKSVAIKDSMDIEVNKRQVVIDSLNLVITSMDSLVYIKDSMLIQRERTSKKLYNEIIGSGRDSAYSIIISNIEGI